MQIANRKLSTATAIHGWQTAICYLAPMNPGLLSAALVHQLQQQAPAAEAQGQLTAEQLAIIYREHWFGIFVPQDYGGLGLSLPQAVRLEENIAFADGSVGWVVTLCAGAGMFIGYLDEALRTEIFSDPFVCLAGSGQAYGQATKYGNEYIVTGHWPYASGSPHATHFTANCQVEGTDDVLAFIFKQGEVTLQPTWSYIGLQATAGYSFSVRELVIPANRAFRISANHITLPDPVYRFPFEQLAESTIAGTLAGMCTGFFDLAEQYLVARQQTNPGPVVSKGIDHLSVCRKQTESARETFYQALDECWAAHVSGTNKLHLLKAVSRQSRCFAAISRNLVNELYPYCGLEAARTVSPINQVWRNINTASQHHILL